MGTSGRASRRSCSRRRAGRSGGAADDALIYGRAGDRYLVVASRGGAPTHPGWYENLAAQPEVHVQVMADRFKARARTATAAEKPALWKTMTAIWPPYGGLSGADGPRDSCRRHRARLSRGPIGASTRMPRAPTSGSAVARSITASPRRSTL